MLEKSLLPIHDRKARGFTLLELILFLILASIAGTMLYTYAAGLNNGLLPVETLRTRLVVQEAMESVVILYKTEILKGSLDLEDFKAKAKVEAEGLGVSCSSTLESGMIEPDDPPILKLTVSLGGQSLWALFTQ